MGRSLEPGRLDTAAWWNAPVLDAGGVDVTPALTWAAGLSGPLTEVHRLEGGWTSTAYTDRTGREPQPHFDVMDVVGFLPPLGRRGFFDDDRDATRRLEERLRAVMARPRG